MADSIKNKLVNSYEFQKRLYERIHGISSSFKINYAINPKLKYDYPPINPIIVENIVNCLISCPKFYTQTLHLMNKLNLPCPLVPFVRVPRQSMVNETGLANSKNIEISQDFLASFNQEQANMSTSESECEMEIENEANFVKTQSKHTKSSLSDTTVKKVNIKSLIKTLPSYSSRDSGKDSQSIEEVFEKRSDIKQTTAKLVMPSRIEALPTQTLVNEEVGLIPSSIGQKIETSSNNEFITLEQLEKNRMKISELKELTVYKNYDKGEPSSKLYLKNLSKKLQESDLKYIFGRYINWNSQDETKLFEIKLMKEGRMKGQAFITFPNEKSAEKALNETIGYLFDDKPMIIQFARAPKN